MSKLLHIGTGIQFSTLEIINVKTFIFVDSAPKHRTCNQEENFGYDNYFIYHMYNIIELYYGYTFKEKINLQESIKVYIFEKQDKVIKYYINVKFPQDFPIQLKDEITDVDHLLICGFAPDKVLFNYINNFTLILSNLSVWGDDSSLMNDEILFDKRLIYIEFNQDNVLLPNYNYKKEIEYELFEHGDYYEYFCEENNLNYTLKNYNTFNTFRKIHLQEIQEIKKKYNLT